MFNTLTKSTIALLSMSMLIACAAEDANGPMLDMQESEQGVVGVFQTGEYQVEFSSLQVEPKVWDINIELNGMTLSVVADQNTGTLAMDGFATDTGGDVQVLDKDRRLLMAFVHELNTLGRTVPAPIQMLRRFVDHYAEYPDTMELQRTAFAEKDRSVSSLCWAMNSYRSATHDDWNYNRWNDKSTTDYAYVSMHGSCSGGEGTNHWNGSWTCYDPGHTTNIEYAYGSCYGRCGGGCGSGTQFTQDCHDHDQCNRAGHSLYSSWCSDELASVSDDLIQAPNCL